MPSSLAPAGRASNPSRVIYAGARARDGEGKSESISALYRAMIRIAHATKPASEMRKNTMPRMSAPAVPRSSPMPAIPAMAPATTESMTATTPGMATKAWVGGGWAHRHG